MNIQISVRRMSVSKKLKKLVNEICIELKHKYQGINLIDVKLEDINGPDKAGIDKRCHIRVRGRERLMLDVEATEEDIYSAIDEAFYRLKSLLLIRDNRMPRATEEMLYLEK